MEPREISFSQPQPESLPLPLPEGREKAKVINISQARARQKDKEYQEPDLQAAEKEIDAKLEHLRYRTAPTLEQELKQIRGFEKEKEACVKDRHYDPARYELFRNVYKPHLAGQANDPNPSFSEKEIKLYLALRQLDEDWANYREDLLDILRDLDDELTGFYERYKGLLYARLGPKLAVVLNTAFLLQLCWKHLEKTEDIKEFKTDITHLANNIKDSYA